SSRVGVAGALVPATPHSSATAANPVTVCANPGYHRPGFARSERPQVTGGERHGITASSRMRGLVVPRDDLVALSIGGLCQVNGPKRGNWIATGIHCSDQLVRCIRRLQFGIGTRMTTG